MELKARRHTAQDIGSAIDLCYTNGWTDGLPVVPPTAERVEAMLAAAKLDPQHQLAFIENRQTKVTAEKVAINAVMAGCKAEYMPGKAMQEVVEKSALYLQQVVQEPLI